MKFKDYLNEESKKGFGVTFVDLDETVFNTFAKIHVLKDGKVVKKLDNQEFNSYMLKDGESYDFREFRSAEIFNKTSIPIKKSVKRIKKMISRIKETGSKSKIIFLTARADFDNKEKFLDTFKEYGIDMNKHHVYVERAGNLSTGTVDARKKQIMMEYLKTGLYRRVRLIDDHKPNLKALIDIKNNLPSWIEDKVRKIYNLSENEEAIKFWALEALPSGDLKEYKG